MTPTTEFVSYSDYKLHNRLVDEIDYQGLSFRKVAFSNAPTYSLVIPAYNEENRIRPFLEQLRDELSEGWEIIVVCDGNDKTAEIANSFDGRFDVYEYGSKLGKGGAILEGFRKAKGEVIGYVDADGSLDSNEIMKVFNSIERESPVAIASRWVKGSKIAVKQPLHRIILGRIYHYVTFAMLGIRQKDTQCGLKAYRRDVLNEIMQKLTLTNLSIDTAILYHCKLRSYRVIEIPVTWKDIGGSRFKPLRTAIVMLGTLVGLRLAHKVKTNNIRNKLTELYELVSRI